MDDQIHGALFFLQKVEDLFLVVALKTTAILQKIVQIMHK